MQPEKSQPEDKLTMPKTRFNRDGISRSASETDDWLFFLPITGKILKFGTPQTIAIIVLKIEKFDVTLH